MRMPRTLAFVSSIAAVAQAAYADPVAPPGRGLNNNPIPFGDSDRAAQFGVKCDGKNGTDNTAVINRMSATFPDVLLPPGECRVTDQLVIPAGHTLRAAGRSETTLYVSRDFKASASGVVRLAGYGARLLDIGIDFAQPDTDIRSKLNTYPVAINALKSGGGWTIDRVRVSHATKVLDMRGEQGQSMIGRFEASFFTSGIELDGSKDSVHMYSVRFWPYGFTPLQYQILLDRDMTINGGQGMIGLNSGRMDGLIIDDFFSIFIPKAMRFYYSQGYNGEAASNGITTAAINKLQLDTTGGLVCDWCDLTISTFYNNIGYSGYSAITMHAGNINIGQLSLVQFGGKGPRGQPEPVSEEPLIQVDNLSSSSKFTMSGVAVNQGSVDRTLLSTARVNAAFQAPEIQISGIGITKDPNKNYIKSVFDLAGASGNIIGVTLNDLTLGSGVMFDAPRDNALTLVGSLPNKWRNIAPINPKQLKINFGMSNGNLTLPGGSIFVGDGVYTGSAGALVQVIDGAQNVRAARFGANGAQPVGKCTVPGPLPSNGSATNAQRDALLNALRTCGVRSGLAQ